MSGFGRTGKLFGFCHADGVVPDVITFAKGVNGAFLPLAGVGMCAHVGPVGIAMNPLRLLGAGEDASISLHFARHTLAIVSAHYFLRILHTGVRDHVAEHFRKVPVMYGSTYNGHPVAVASGYATVRHMLKHKIVEHAAAMESHMVVRNSGQRSACS